MLFAHLPLHSRQTWGVVAAVAGVLVVKFHYIYRIFKDPGDLEDDFIYDEDDNGKIEKGEEEASKKDK